MYLALGFLLPTNLLPLPHCGLTKVYPKSPLVKCMAFLLQIQFKLARAIKAT